MTQVQQNFTLEASPDSDLWRKPPNTDICNIPHTLAESFPLKTFQSARITFSGAWTERYDQAGILVSFADDLSSASWIKAGLEYYNKTPHISFVGCDRFADWSVHPAHAPNPNEKVTRAPARRGREWNGALGL